MLRATSEYQDTFRTDNPTSRYIATDRTATDVFTSDLFGIEWRFERLTGFSIRMSFTKEDHDTTRQIERSNLPASFAAF
jgi:hypothetical protein